MDAPQYLGLPPPFMSPAAQPMPHTHALMRRAIAGVMRNAQSGELPLFVWTLGLPQKELLSAIHALFPELGTLEPMPEDEYAVLSQVPPPLFGDLLELLICHLNTAHKTPHGLWLSRAIAAAAMGERHLWQDLGLSSRHEIAHLLATCFPDLHARNHNHLKWKRFLFDELGRQLGIIDLYPPGCGKCSELSICFPFRASRDCPP
jgi:nitrogen fixation protein NifQ